ncbi:MAG: hypothetical protein MUO54_15385 [Anaerolineales bacterium]|nr:hypothetical protein [Anaerolineales bacterium]
MKINRLFIGFCTLLMVLTIGACNLTQPGMVETEVIIDEVIETITPDVIPPTEEIQPTYAQEDSSEPSSKRYSFDQLGISLEVPAELYVQKDPIVNYDDPSKLDSYLFYIQNYGYPGGLSSGDFQMYGWLQFDLPPVSWEQFASNTLNSPTNAYANPIEINGLKGFDTQLSVTRNRFVYLFYINQHILSIAVSAPTEENKALADQIISTLIVNPDQFTNVSHIQKVVEPNFYYQMYIPDDWNINFKSSAGIRLSELEASSPDAEVVVEETEGPHSNILYKNGLVMNFVVLEDDSALSEPNMALIHNKNDIMLAGFEGTDYTFVEPSTVEGELREIRFYYDGKSYLLRFGYSSDVDKEQIDWMIRNLEITRYE